MKNYLTGEIANLISMLRGIEKDKLKLSQRILIERSIAKLESIKGAIYFILPN